MKLAISRLVIVAATAVVIVVAGASPVLAQIPNFPSGFTSTQLCPGTSSPTTGCVVAVNGGTLGADLTTIQSGWTPDVNSTALELTQNAGDQRGSAWFITPQPVTQPWTSVFQFKLTSGGTGDGFAFVIQNNGGSSLSEVGGFGGGIGYGTRCVDLIDDMTGLCTPYATDTGIPNSVAIEFDTFQNFYETDAHHVAVQSCGSDPNVPDHNQCAFGYATIPAMTDGNAHTVRIDYNPNISCDGDPCPNLFVSIDGTQVLTTYVDLYSHLGLGDGGSTAYVGFTAATGGATEAHDILNWTFSVPQTQMVTGGTLATFNFNGGAGNGGFDYTIMLNSGEQTSVTVSPMVTTQAYCDGLTHTNPNFLGAQCLAYDNADGMGGSFPVLFEVTCSGGPCGTTGSPTFAGELGTDYHFEVPPNGNTNFSTVLPLPGWLKGDGGVTGEPCFAPTGLAAGKLPASNQIDIFTFGGDPSGTTKGRSGGTGSCWWATYNTPNETPSVSITTPAPGANYPQGASIPSSFMCLTANNGGAVGPYLTPTSCTASIDGGPPITSGAPIVTTQGSHTFVASVTDSGSDTITKTVTYNVVAPADLAILKVAPLSVSSGGKITYSIGVGNVSGANALNVTVKDTLPAGLATSPAPTASAGNVSCSLVSKKIVCTTTSKPCTVSVVSGVATVACNVGTIVPLSLSPLNGATVQISTKVTAAAGTTKSPVVISNTATVSADNMDPHTNNNSSTAKTTVTH